MALQLPHGLYTEHFLQTPAAEKAIDLSLSDVNNSLESVLKQNDKVTITFNDTAGSVSHFYHTVMNAMFPLYAKMILPFALNGAQPPHRRIYLPDVGGTLFLVQEVFPWFDFTFVPLDAINRSRPWPFYSLTSDSFGLPPFNTSLTNYRKITHQLNGFRHYVLHQFETLEMSYDQAEDHYKAESLENIVTLTGLDAQLLANLARNLVRQLDGGDLLYVSRREPAGNSGDVKDGVSRSGADKRYIANEDRMVTILRMLLKLDIVTHPFSRAPQVHMAHLGNMTFGAQVQLHRKTNVLMSQHGAALVHCLWMPHAAALIEITEPNGPRYFNWLCKQVREMKYMQYRMKDKCGGKCSEGEGEVIPLWDFFPKVLNFLS